MVAVPHDRTYQLPICRFRAVCANAIDTFGCLRGATRDRMRWILTSQKNVPVGNCASYIFFTVQFYYL